MKFSQKEAGKMMADVIFSAIVDEISVRVVEVEKVARLLKDGVAL